MRITNKPENDPADAAIMIKNSFEFECVTGCIELATTLGVGLTLIVIVRVREFERDT
jgi:hypothetical protein